MALSRFRLRLLRGFGIAFFAGSMILEGGSYWYVTWTNSYDFNERLKDAARSVRSVIDETGRVGVDSTVFTGVQQAMADYRPSKLIFVVYDSTGQLLASGGSRDLVHVTPSVDDLPDVGDIAYIPLAGRLHLRIAADTAHGRYVVAGATTDVLRRTQRRFFLRLLYALPLALLLALAIGYLLAGYALAPIEALGRAAEALDPGELAGRLPVHDRPDELDRLAVRFNVLLGQIQALQAQSTHFLREVAHQIRTPLTLVLGETELVLERDRSSDDYVRALRRIHSAAGQMTHRVQDLLLLARMEAGERPPLRDAVELDALALEITDLFRSRAHTLGQHLELQNVMPCEVSGDEALLREALLEMLENACRHGDASTPVSVSVTADGSFAVLEVRNGGDPITTAPRAVERTDDAGPAGGLGLAIMRWIASVHGGELLIRRSGNDNLVGLRLPLRPGSG
ncbi:MAG TPA: HAMP domain-containing sensor histidine kinase [Gemmatimonadales bacterium]|jgi:signal transduction histidine kinase